MRRLVVQGVVPASSMTNVAHIDARLDQLASGQTMPDPPGTTATPGAQERARTALWNGQR
jgi:hypothetical protein